MSLKRIDNSTHFFRETTSRDFEQILDRFSENGNKSIVLFSQPHILASLTVLIELPKILDNFGFIKGCHSLEEPLNDAKSLTAGVVVYLFNPSAEYLNTIVDHFQQYTERVLNAVPKFVCIPEKTVMVEQILEQDFDLRDKIPGMEITQLDIDLQYIDHPLLSMNLRDSYCRIFCDGDLSVLRWVSRLLFKVQSTWLGAFPDIVTVGSTAMRVAKMLESMELETGVDMLKNMEPTIDKMFIIDRSVDVVTPLLTQLTYEGLIEELYGLDCSQVSFPFPLDSFSDSNSPYYFCGIHDKVFMDLRDKTFAKVGAYLSERSLEVKHQYDKRKDLNELKEVREFVENLSELQEMHRLIGVHTSLASRVGKLSQNPMFRKRVVIEQYILQQINEKEVFEFIEELINNKNDLNLLLRVLCLYSVVNGGLKVRDYDAFKERMVLSFGMCETMSMFYALGKCSLLTRYRGRPSDYVNWKRCRMGYHPLPTDGGDNVPQTLPNAHGHGPPPATDSEEMRDLYGGAYIPPLVRLVETHLRVRSGAATARSLSTLLEVLSTDVHHKIVPFVEMPASGAPRPAAVSPSSSSPLQSSAATPSSGSSLATSLFVVVGGLTAAEMGGLRQLQKQYPQSPFIVCTTEVIVGDRWVDGMIREVM